MTYNVFGGTLSLTRSLSLPIVPVCSHLYCVTFLSRRISVKLATIFTMCGGGHCGKGFQGQRSKVKVICDVYICVNAVIVQAYISVVLGYLS